MNRTIMPQEYTSRLEEICATFECKIDEALEEEEDETYSYQGLIDMAEHFFELPEQPVYTQTRSKEKHIKQLEQIIGCVIKKVGRDKYILTDEKPEHSLQYFVYHLCKRHKYLTVGYILKAFDLDFLTDEERITRHVDSKKPKGFARAGYHIALTDWQEAYYQIAYNKIHRTLEFLEKNGYILLEKVPMISYGKGTTPEEIKHIEWFKNFKKQVLYYWNSANKYQITDKKSFNYCHTKDKLDELIKQGLEHYNEDLRKLGYNYKDIKCLYDGYKVLITDKLFIDTGSKRAKKPKEIIINTLINTTDKRLENIKDTEKNFLLEL